LDEFTGFCRALSKCLRRIDGIVGSDNDRLFYRVVGMKTASASVTLEAAHSATGDIDGEKVFGLFRDTAARLQAGKTPDNRLAFDDIQAFRELLSPLGRHTSQIWVDGIRLTAKYVTTIDRILGSAIPSEGEVTGCLERLNLHGRSEFVLFPVAGHKIACTFHKSLLEAVRKGIKRTVTVSGTLYFQPDKPLPERVRVKRMEIHPPDNSLPRLRDLKGLSRRCTGKMTSVEFVRAIRDA